MKIDIVVVYVQRYEHGHETNFVPPITGIHLAAITPSQHQVRVIHQQVEEPDFETDADLIAISFFSGFAPEAYLMAERYRALGKTVVAGGSAVGRDWRRCSVLECAYSVSRDPRLQAVSG